MEGFNGYSKTNNFLSKFDSEDRFFRGSKFLEKKQVKFVESRLEDMLTLGRKGFSTT